MAAIAMDHLQFADTNFRAMVEDCLAMRSHQCDIAAVVLGACGCTSVT